MTDESTTEATTDTTAEAEAPKPAPKPHPPANQQPAADDKADRIAVLEAELKAARDDAAKTRINAKQKAAEEREHAIVSQVLKALGLNESGEKEVTTDDLMSELNKTKAEMRRLQLRDAARRTAPEGIDPERVLRLVDFAEATAEVDPTDLDAVKAAVESVVKANPWVRGPEKVQASGPEPKAGPSGNALTVDDFRAMEGSARQKLYDTDRANYDRLVREALTH